MSFQIDCGFKGFHSAGSYQLDYDFLWNQITAFVITDGYGLKNRIMAFVILDGYGFKDRIIACTTKVCNLALILC